MFIHEEIRDNHIHIPDVTTIYLPNVINNYIHILDAIYNIHNSDIINNYIHIPDIIISHIYISDDINNRIHKPDDINNHIHMLDVTTYIQAYFNKIISILPFDHLRFNPVPSSDTINNYTPLRSPPVQPDPFLLYKK